ncbi:MAG: exodeoxyribonuclease VII large subunit [Proteobacteria bacterium]|nr:exodeoxyribonuclease VII large subunit [Pseudomonadota bacterium]
MNTSPGHNATHRDVYSISRLNREVRAVLEGSFLTLWVEGEISNLAQPGSGHWYFSLKDQSSQVRCAMFRNKNRYLKFAPDNGMQILARVNVSLYEGRGEFQLIVEHMEQAGEGALQRAFEALKQRLQKQGLFDEDRKRPMPALPRTIGVITSPTGAAIRDILTVLKRRYPLANVIIYPVPVQGDGAAETIAETIELAQQRHETDVLILSRGGGSLEDLWAFNEEVVARAIYQCKIPVVCGVGHEIDFTIADFVADQRAATPSAAAELLSPDQAELLDRLGSLANRIHSHIKHQLQRMGHTLLQLEKRLPHPKRQLQNISQRLDELSLRMQQSIRTNITLQQSLLLKLSAQINQHNPLQTLRAHKEKCYMLRGRLRKSLSYGLQTARGNFERLTHNLHTVSPLATLERGYAIVSQTDNGNIVRDASILHEGETIKTRLAKGRIHSIVKKITP